MDRLEVVADPSRSPRTTIPVMAAVADHVCAGRDVGQLAEPLIDLVRSPSTRPELIWLATECLDHVSPPPVTDPFIDGPGQPDPSDLGVLGAALTRLAWGDLAQLPLLRAGVSQSDPVLAYEESFNSYFYPSRLWNRLLPAVARHEKEWLVSELTSQIDEGRQGRLGGLAGLTGLLVLDTDLALRVWSTDVGSERHADDWSTSDPVTIRPESTPVALAVLERLSRIAPSVSWRGTTSISDELLRAVAAVADDVECVRRLAPLLSSELDAPAVYDALFEVARRAKVRVMPDGRLEAFGE